MTRCLVIIGVLIVSSCFPAFATDDVESKKRLVSMVMSTAESNRIDTSLFIALAIKESNFNPLAVHLSSPARPATRLGWKLHLLGVPYTYYQRNGRYHYNARPQTYQQATKLLRWAQTKRFVWYDVGLFQVSNFKMEDMDLDPVHLLNPEINAVYAAQIFRKCLDSERGTAYALECYHRGRSRGKITSYALHTLKIAKRLRRHPPLPKGRGLAG